MAEFQSDATLLERFANGREEEAFAALVRRHGPRVERICRRILRNEQDVEDVFQSTFLVLARKAAGIAWRDSASPWIDGVARRLALHARSGAARRRGRERAITTLTGGPTAHDGGLPEHYHPLVETFPEIERRDLRCVLDDELLRLPEKYRAPVVLCDLEGHTREEAARRLGWPTGSMSRRLDRARTLLRRRLTHRGIGLAVVGIASIAIAAAGLGPRADRSLHASSVRQAMASFRSESDGGRGYGQVLAAAASNPGDRPDFARILPAAHDAAVAARRIRGLARGPRAAIWDRHVAEMERSASDLERACRDSDAPALVAAARRLDASCTTCHAVFRSAKTSPTTLRPALPRAPASAPRERVAQEARVGVARVVVRRAEPPGASPTAPAQPQSSIVRLPIVNRFREAVCSPVPAVNEWDGTSVKTVGPLCSVMASDRRAILARPGWG
jgi:RNA polymerase sigma factor (sigma-70 family)